MKYLVKTILITATIFLGSCSDWLDVKPEMTIEADELLSKEKGFTKAINGVYYTLSTGDLYGENLSLGMLDAMAQTWKVLEPVHYLYEVGAYNYEDAATKSRVNSIWYKMYIAIGSCNKLLENIDGIEDASVEEKKLIRAELLGLRAFMHMEILKLFGESNLEANLTNKVLPYRYNFDNKPVEFSTVEAVFSKLHDDIDEAESLYEGTDNIRFNRYKMNYYAVLAIKARLYQLEGNKTETYNMSKQLIDMFEEVSEVHFTTQNQIANQSDGYRDLKFSSEKIFALYQDDQFEVLKGLFEENIATSFENKTLRLPYNGVMDVLFNNEGGDYRFLYLMAPEEQNAYKYLKFREPKDDRYDPLISMISLPEIYYMAAEAKIGVDNEMAKDYVQEVRNNRGLSNIDVTDDIPNADESVLKFLLNEMQREFIGEGKMFFTYKRLNREIDGIQRDVSLDDIVWKLPVPDKEIEFTNN